MLNTKPEIQSRKYPKGYWKGFIMLMIVYSLLQLLYYLPVSSQPKLFSKLAISPLPILLLPAYAIGAYIFKGTGLIWLSSLWHIIHLAAITFILLILAYGRIIGPAPFGIGNAVRPAIELLISPIPYIVIGLIYMTTQSSRPS
jgi:hypothetical protein